MGTPLANDKVYIDIYDINSSSVTISVYCQRSKDPKTGEPIYGGVKYNPSFNFDEAVGINEEKYTVTINPELNIKDRSKIGHYLDDTGDVDNYIFFYQDSNNNWCKVDEPIESKNTKILSDDESSYVEKYVTTKTILNLELNESDDNYITIEEAVSYKLYYNPKELIEIT